MKRKACHKSRVIRGQPVSQAAHLVVGVETGLGEGVEPLRGHHARHSAGGCLDVAQLRQEQRRAQEPNLHPQARSQSLP